MAAKIGKAYEATKKPRAKKVKVPPPSMDQFFVVISRSRTNLKGTIYDDLIRVAPTLEKAIDYATEEANESGPPTRDGREESFYICVPIRRFAMVIPKQPEPKVESTPLAFPEVDW